MNFDFVLVITSCYGLCILMQGTRGRMHKPWYSKEDLANSVRCSFSGSAPSGALHTQAIALKRCYN